MQFYDLFPTPVLHANIGRPISQKEMDVALYHYQEGMCEGNESHKSSVEKYVLEKHGEELQDIVQFIQQATVAYIDEVICPATELSFHFTNSWFTYNEPGGQHHPHFHQNCILAGAFYFTGEGYDDGVSFIDSRPPKQIWIPPRHVNHRNEESRTLPVYPGDLYIFPHDLQHAVLPTQSKGTRICMPYNVWISGTVGTDYDVNKGRVDFNLRSPQLS